MLRQPLVGLSVGGFSLGQTSACQGILGKRPPFCEWYNSSDLPVLRSLLPPWEERVDSIAGNGIEWAYSSTSRPVDSGMASRSVWLAALLWLLFTVICYRLRFNVATAALLYVIVVVLLSRTGNFVSSIFVSIIAALSLAYIAPPAYSFRVDDPLDDVAIMAFLVTALVIASLVSKLHNAAEEALSSVNRRLIESEERERARIARELHDDIGQRLALLTNELEQLQHDPPTLREVRSRVRRPTEADHPVSNGRPILVPRVALVETGISGFGCRYEKLFAESSGNSRNWRLTSKAAICPFYRRTSPFPSGFCSKPCTMRRCTVGHGSPKLNCSE